MAAGESGCPGSPRLSPAQHSPLPAAHHRNFPRDEMSAGSVPEPVGKAGVRRPSLGRGVPAAWPPCPGAGCGCCVPGVPLHRQVRAPSGSRCPQGRRCHGFGLILHRALFLPARLFGRDLSSVPREQPSAPRCRGEGLQWQQVKRPRSPPSLLLLFFSPRLHPHGCRERARSDRAVGRRGAPAVGAAAVPAGPHGGLLS